MISRSFYIVAFRTPKFFCLTFNVHCYLVMTWLCWLFTHCYPWHTNDSVKRKLLALFGTFSQYILASVLCSSFAFQLKYSLHLCTFKSHPTFKAWFKYLFLHWVFLIQCFQPTSILPKSESDLFLLITVLFYLCHFSVNNSL